MKPFVVSHNIKTVNAELIKTNLSLSTVAGAYMLHKKQRGQPDGEIVRGFRNKTEAYGHATQIMNAYWEIRADENKSH